MSGWLGSEDFLVGKLVFLVSIEREGFVTNV